MGENIVGFFSTEDDAGSALAALRSAGFNEQQVSLIAKNPRAAANALERREAQSEAVTTQDEAAVEVPQEQFAAAQPGGMYIIVRAHSEEEARRAIELLHHANVAEIEHRDQEYHEGDWAHPDEVVNEVNAPRTQSRGM